MAYRINHERVKRPRKIRNRPEQALQIRVMQYLETVLPSDAIAFHVPNAAKRGFVEGKKMKQMGVRSGIPDIIIFCRGKTYTIELKAPGKSTNDNQDEMGTRIEQAGMSWGVAKSVDQVENLLWHWRVPTRAQIAA